MTDPILRSLLLAVLEEPGCDLHRLAYADRCEELGDDARAEFVRLQCRIATIEAACLCGDCVRRRGGGQCHNGPCAVNRERDELPDGRSQQALLRLREAELWGVNADESLQLDEPLWGLPAWHVAGWSPNRIHLVDRRSEAHTDTYFTFRRGFVEEIRLTLADFMPHAAALFAAHPITEVKLTDRKPGGLPGPAYWWYDSDSLNKTTRRASPHHLPDGLFHGLVQGEVEGAIVSYRSRDAALAALSRVCVDHGRHLAGLPGVAISRPSLSDDTEGGEK